MYIFISKSIFPRKKSLKNKSFLNLKIRKLLFFSLFTECTFHEIHTSIGKKLNIFDNKNCRNCWIWMFTIHLTWIWKIYVLPKQCILDKFSKTNIFQNWIEKIWKLFLRMYIFCCSPMVMKYFFYHLDHFKMYRFCHKAIGMNECWKNYNPNIGEGTLCLP